MSVAMENSTSSDPTAIARLGAIAEAALQASTGGAIGTDPDLAPFAAALRYPLAAGGKRLRPVLLLATVEGLGGDVQAALPSACALELIHTFSLVHDDLPALDDDSLRRGLPTTHIEFGEDVAILVGDGLFALAFRLIAEANETPAEVRLAVLAELARATDGMVRGQYLDLRPVANPDEAWLRKMCGLKTGCLIEAGVTMGLALAAADTQTTESYTAFAAELGVGFQIVDDVLDATSTTDTLGKTAGADVANERSTFVTVLGLDEAQAAVERSWQKTERLLAALPGNPAALAAIAKRIYHRDR
jgi:geranylgeranyl diphosphate synthase type II